MVGKKVKKSHKILISVLFCIIFAVISGLFKYHGKKETVTEERCVEHIVVTYNYIAGNQMNHLDQIVDKINEISRKKIGVEIELLPVNSQDVNKKYPLWLSQGKEIDLMVLNYQDITSYTDKGMLCPLNQLLHTSGNDIQEMINNGDALGSGATIEKKIYGLNVPEVEYGSGGGIWIPERYLKNMSFQFKENHIYTVDELTTLFEELKGKYPDSYPLGQITSGNTFSTYSYYRERMETAASERNTGYVTENGTVLDFYETEEYYSFLQQMRKWYQEGYIYPDSSFTNSSAIDLLQEGIVLSIPLGSAPGMYSEESIGEKVVCLRTTKIVNAPSTANGTFWTIPSTSTNPESAMKFLNLMYTDPEIVNLLQWGIEGVDYKIIDEKKGRIICLGGPSGNKDCYYNPLGMYGNQKIAYSTDSDELIKEKKAYAALSENVGEEYADFTFLIGPVSVELMQVQEVLNRYFPILESGSVELETNYNNFIQELKTAGIEKVIAEKQRQLDAWKQKKEP